MLFERTRITLCRQNKKLFALLRAPKRATRLTCGDGAVRGPDARDAPRTSNRLECLQEDHNITPSHTSHTPPCMTDRFIQEVLIGPPSDPRPAITATRNGDSYSIETS